MSTPLICEECGKEFKTGYDCFQHRRASHDIVPKKWTRYINKYMTDEERIREDHLTEADYQTWMRL